MSFLHPKALMTEPHYFHTPFLCSSFYPGGEADYPKVSAMTRNRGRGAKPGQGLEKTVGKPEETECYYCFDG